MNTILKVSFKLAIALTRTICIGLKSFSAHWMVRVSRTGVKADMTFPSQGSSLKPPSALLCTDTIGGKKTPRKQRNHWMMSPSAVLCNNLRRLQHRGTCDFGISWGYLKSITSWERRMTQFKAVWYNLHQILRVDFIPTLIISLKSEPWKCLREIWSKSIWQASS